MAEKTWGGEPFWGLGYEWDPDWVLTDRQKELRDTLIELCEKEMRANAKISDDELKFPRRNLELLGEHGFLALTVPEEYGGLGENHVAYSMVCETIARYGCASTAMCLAASSAGRGRSGGLVPVGRSVPHSAIPRSWKRQRTC